MPFVGEYCKPCRAAYKLDYRAKNGAKIAAARADHYARNKSEIREKNDAWKRENREKNAASDAEYRATHKAEIAARNAAYYEQNKDVIHAKAAERYAANPEPVREYNAAYYAANAEACNARSLAYRLAHLEESRQRSREYHRFHAEELSRKKRIYREAHVEGERARGLSWRARNRERVSVNRQARRAREIAAPGFHTEEEWIAKKAAFGNRCIDCGMSEGERFPKSASPRYAGKLMRLTVGHAIPLKPRRNSGFERGSNWIENIIPQCGPCNHRQHNRIHPSVAMASQFECCLLRTVFDPTTEHRSGLHDEHAVDIDGGRLAG